ncbi:MAG: hypothetical protein ACYC3A_11390 [Halothiobacillus sp.]
MTSPGFLVDHNREVHRLQYSKPLILNVIYWVARSFFGLQVGVLVITSLFSGATHAAGEAGTLHYSGFESGVMVFDSAECAPTKDETINVIKAPAGPAQTSQFISLQEHYFAIVGAIRKGRAFMQDHDAQGISIKNHLGIWSVSFANTRVRVLCDPLKECMGIEPPPSIVLNGTLTCTDNITQKTLERLRKDRENKK